MNSGEINNFATLLVAIVGPLLVKYGVSTDVTAQLIPAVLAGVWGVYSHWNQKKVPENSTVIPSVSRGDK